MSEKQVADPQSDGTVNVQYSPSNTISKDVEIANLEWKVVEAAVARRKESAPQKPPFDYARGLRYFNANAEFEKAVDALIAAREKAEK